MKGEKRKVMIWFVCYYIKKTKQTLSKHEYYIGAGINQLINAMNKGMHV